MFTDEKKFNFDGPDSWSSWADEERKIYRNRRQMGEGSIMIWLALLPDGNLVLDQVDGRLNSEKYVDFLETIALPRIEALYCPKNLCFQQDNARPHIAKASMQWLKSHFGSILDWPAKSPDLNPVENIWKMLSNLVYDGLEYRRKDDLYDSINSAAARLMQEKKKLWSVWLKVYLLGF